jgi:hypothetical protein
MPARPGQPPCEGFPRQLLRAAAVLAISGPPTGASPTGTAVAAWSLAQPKAGLAPGLSQVLYMSWPWERIATSEVPPSRTSIRATGQVNLVGTRHPASRSGPVHAFTIARGRIQDAGDGDHPPGRRPADLSGIMDSLLHPALVLVRPVEALLPEAPVPGRPVGCLLEARPAAARAAAGRSAARDQPGPLQHWVVAAPIAPGAANGRRLPVLPGSCHRPVQAAVGCFRWGGVAVSRPSGWRCSRQPPSSTAR